MRLLKYSHRKNLFCITYLYCTKWFYLIKTISIKLSMKSLPGKYICGRTDFSITLFAFIALRECRISRTRIKRVN